MFELTRIALFCFVNLPGVGIRYSFAASLNFHIASYGLFRILIDANLPKCRILKWSKLFALCKIGFSSLQSLY
jgi:hypothetical protein